MIGEGFSMLVRHQQQSSRKASDRPHMISHEFSGISGGKAWKEQHGSSAHLSSCLRLTWPRLVRPWMNWWPMPRRQRQWAKMKEGPDLGCQGLDINLVWEWLTSHWDGLWVGHSKFMIFCGFKFQVTKFQPYPDWFGLWASLREIRVFMAKPSFWDVLGVNMCKLRVCNIVVSIEPVCVYGLFSHLAVSQAYTRLQYTLWTGSTQAVNGTGQSPWWTKRQCSQPFTKAGWSTK